MRKFSVLALLLAASFSAGAQSALDRAKQQYASEQERKAQTENASAAYGAAAWAPIQAIDTRVQAALRMRPLPEKVSLAYLLGYSNDVSAPWDESASARAVELTRRIAPGCLSAMDDLVMAWYRLSETISTSSDRASFSQALIAACNRTPPPYAGWDGGQIGHWYGYFLDRVKQHSWKYFDLAGDMRRRSLDTGAQATSHSDGLTDPVAVFTPVPGIPAALIRAGGGGKARVTLKLSVAPSGQVADASVLESSGKPEIDKAALGKTKVWRFQPGRDAVGNPVQVDIKVPVDFAW